MLSTLALFAVTAFLQVAAQAQTGRPSDASLQQLLSSGSGFYRSANAVLMLSPDGHFRHSASPGTTASDDFSAWTGVWTRDAGAGELCLHPLPVQPLLFAGGKPSGRMLAVRYSAVLARSGVVAAGEQFDGPSLIKAQTDEWRAPETTSGRESPPTMESRPAGPEDRILGVARGARFIYVALPVRREGAQVRYTGYRFPLAKGATDYRVVLAGGLPGAGVRPDGLQGCRPLAGYGFTEARELTAAERTTLQAQIVAALASADAAGRASVSTDVKRNAWRQVEALETTAFSMPQTSLPLTVGRRQPDLYQAATDALRKGGPAFSQSAAEARASTPGERVLGSAAGFYSPSDFDVQLRLMGKGLLDIAVLSNRQPLEINEERARARELFDRVLHAFPMLSPVPATPQEKKP